MGDGSTFDIETLPRLQAILDGLGPGQAVSLPYKDCYRLFGIDNALAGRVANFARGHRCIVIWHAAGPTFRRLPPTADAPALLSHDGSAGQLGRNGGETLPAMLTYPVLLADIGGTYSRFAVLAAPRTSPSPIWKVVTAEFPTPVAAIRTYLDRVDVARPRAAFLAVAGRVDGPVARLTNAPWRFDLGEIGAALDLDAVRLVNDYVPTAAALAILDETDPTDLVPIGPATARALSAEVDAGSAQESAAKQGLRAVPDCNAIGNGSSRGPRLVLGPGTGLGAAALIPAGDRLLIQTSEAGHVGFGPCTMDDGLPWSDFMATEGRLAAETLLSGPGLLRLARALAAARGVAANWHTPPEVLEAARGDPVASEAVRQFARLLGRFAGDLALVFAATGGVYLAGGIAPRIVEILRSEAFCTTFEDKAPFSEVMRAIPRLVITRPEPAIDGLAALLRAQDRFLFPGQDWRA